ncbi:MAG: hypothetical protein JSU05_02470 [Bacteroidetes bacterium]|nr:hypothetical protein [Bacteroidota bacterium]
MKAVIISVLLLPLPFILVMSTGKTNQLPVTPACVPRKGAYDNAAGTNHSPEPGIGYLLQARI